MTELLFEDPKFAITPPQQSFLASRGGSMDKPKFSFVIDAAMFLCVMALAGLGFLMKYLLPSGRDAWAKYGSNLYLSWLGWDRHDWGDIHLYLAGVNSGREVKVMMKKLSLMAGILGVWAFLMGPPSWAQEQARPAAPKASRLYNPQAVETLTGQVAAVNRHAAKKAGRPERVTMVLQTAQGTVKVNLGPRRTTWTSRP
jgi:hypothetical protein